MHGKTTRCIFCVPRKGTKQGWRNLELGLVQVEVGMPRTRNPRNIPHSRKPRSCSSSFCSCLLCSAAGFAFASASWEDSFLSFSTKSEIRVGRRFPQSLARFSDARSLRIEERSPPNRENLSPPALLRGINEDNYGPLWENNPWRKLNSSAKVKF